MHNNKNTVWKYVLNFSLKSKYLSVCVYCMRCIVCDLPEEQ